MTDFEIKKAQAGQTIIFSNGCYSDRQTQFVGCAVKDFDILEEKSAFIALLNLTKGATMTSKLKCPFCGEKLYSSDNCYVCLNDGCIFCGFHFMEKRWKPIIELKQSLIQAKQDLEIARKALKNMSLGNVPSLPDDETLANAMCNYARNTLKQIEHKE